MNVIFEKPYKVFFLIGVLGLLVGVGLWVPYGFGIMNFYPGEVHSHLVIGTFLTGFIIGFILTTFPMMIHASKAHKVEIAVLLCLYCGVIFTNFYVGGEKHFFVFFISLLVSVLLFCLKRILNAKLALPPFYPMILMSFFSGIIGGVFFLLGFANLGKSLIFFNLILSLCVGIGSKLIPMILGIGCAPRFKSWQMWVIGSLLILICFAEQTRLATYASALRFFIIFYVAILMWRIHEFSAMATTTAWGVRLAAIMILVGTLGIWLGNSAYYLEYLHIVYVGGFTLLTLMVGTRLILAYGQYNLQLESKNWWLRSVVGLVIFAMATRFSAPLIPDGYQRHLAYAAIVLLLALCLWGKAILSKLIRRK